MSAPMDSQCIPFKEIPDTFKLFSAFLDDFSKVSAYYSHPPTEAGIDAAAREVRLDPQVRRQVVEVLREQNRAFSADASTEKNIDRLATGAVAIVTGQQVGLFSGPAYTLYKAIAAIAAAAELTKRGTDAVPIFWLATEDHDLAEINHTFFNTRAGMSHYELAQRPEDASKRVGKVKLGAEIEPVVGAACESLQGSFCEEISRALRESYTPNETYGSAFGKLMKKLLAGRGMIFLDSMDARLHRLALPTLRQALEKCDALGDALMARSKELEDRGFHAQVKVTREATLLFCDIDGRREPIHRKNGNFFAGKASFTRDELLASLESRPEDFSPNALLRPVMQDTLLPTAAYIGGSAEIAYMAQNNVIYKEILGRMPAILPRASFTVIEAPIANLLEKYDLTLHDFFQGRQHLRSKLEAKFLPPGLAAQFEKDAEALQTLLNGYKSSLEKLDPTLLGVVDSAQEKILYQFEKLKGKVSRAENMRTGVLDRHEKILLDSLYPDRGLQERTACILPLLAEYGLEFLDDLLRVCPAPGSAAKAQCAQQHHVLDLK